ncbi:hypothetical protein PJF56_05410 [Roseofilum sp. BLCC_M91]|uniref:Uncharacterized protein n=1 Tax=Roseofilum halophilum BLCC-M91 TaxID=3022259 RepID=A0ABT7BGI4_9CYAN|nr:hypothetical protein [Roseofilum halophilum]MDJ1178293.1 hypothetical protein [Roseofilum halophilum BLCC-M91]
MRPPDDDFSGSVQGCLGQVVTYLVVAVVLFFLVLFACGYFHTTFNTVLLVWLGLMMFVSLAFILKMTED